MREEDLLKLRLEREVADMRLELLRENQLLHRELDALKASSAQLLQDVQSQIVNAQDKITERAIDKTLGVLQHMKGWVTAIAGVFTVMVLIATFLGLQHSTNLMTALFNSRVDNWMRFEDKDSDGAKALDR